MAHHFGHRKLKAVASAKIAVAWPDGNARPESVFTHPTRCSNSPGRGRSTHLFKKAVIAAAAGTPTQVPTKGMNGRFFTRATTTSAAPAMATIRTALGSPKWVIPRQNGSHKG